MSHKFHEEIEVLKKKTLGLLGWSRCETDPSIASPFLDDLLHVKFIWFLIDTYHTSN